MAQTCNNCGDTEQRNGKITMTEWAYEAQEARKERQFKRMWIALIVAIALMFAEFAGFMIYFNQYDVYSYDYTQDGNGQNNINYGEQGDLINEPKVENTDTQEKEE